MNTELYPRVCQTAETAGLLVMGALHPAKCGAKGLEGGTLVLLGAGPDFWPVFSASQEASDGQPDPIDRWSLRVIGDLAHRLGAEPHYPFGGPPFAPFIDWALKSQRAHLSPVGMMVHDTVGLMISFRGALHFAHEFELPQINPASPCEECIDQPCASACPVGALKKGTAYDLDRCHSYLETGAGQACMTQGCAARRACPISAGAARKAAQSALHMKAFHPEIG